MGGVGHGGVEGARDDGGATGDDRDDRERLGMTGRQ